MFWAAFFLMTSMGCQRGLRLTGGNTQTIGGNGPEAQCSVAGLYYAYKHLGYTEGSARITLSLLESHLGSLRLETQKGGITNYDLGWQQAAELLTMDFGSSSPCSPTDGLVRFQISFQGCDNLTLSLQQEDCAVDFSNVDFQETEVSLPSPESVCDDGLDNDADGVADCADDDCNTFCDSGLQCGNKNCDAGETLANCPVDCPLGTGEDGGGGSACAASETNCADSIDDDCDGFDDCDDSDCAAALECIPATLSCGDSICNGESYATCPMDCAPVCGDSICEGPEDSSNCPSDCCALVETDCNDGIDEDCDTVIDCADTDDCSGALECAPACTPIGAEDGDYGDGVPNGCVDGVDDDCDGQVDCGDSDCGATCYCPTGGAGGEICCNGNVDDDGDGQADCSDTDCAWMGCT